MTIEELSTQLIEMRRDIDARFAVIDAKLDAKPSIAVLYQAVATLAFGIGAVISATVVVLKATGKLG